MHYSLLQADKYGVPRMCFINKMDRMGANFYKAVDSIVNLLGAKPCILQVLLIHACCANHILRIHESSPSAPSAACSRYVRGRVSKTRRMPAAAHHIILACLLRNTFYSYMHALVSRRLRLNFPFFSCAQLPIGYESDL